MRLAELNKLIQSGETNHIISDEEIEKAMMAQAIVEINKHDFDEVIDNDFGLQAFYKENNEELSLQFQQWLDNLNWLRKKYLETKDRRYWRLFWDLCPVSYVYDT